ncbi:hypothetical protein ACH4T9_24640 [Micromonospora sp. NPDC020750]|uniref:hypothetical protein n=1 Tax=unclassified Micromonospora TaxID=2617518 RepID=UPI0037BA206D
MTSARRLSMFIASGGVLSVLAAAGWPMVVLLLVTTGMAVSLVGWVVNDRERPERLALLIRAARQSPVPIRSIRSRPPT